MVPSPVLIIVPLPEMVFVMESSESEAAPMVELPSRVSVPLLVRLVMLTPAPLRVAVSFSATVTFVAVRVELKLTSPESSRLLAVVVELT